MRFGRCEWILKKNNSENFTRFIIENVIMKIGYSPNNPHFNRVCFFDNMGEEHECDESEFILNKCGTHKIIDLVLWKDHEDIEICFDRTDKNYDIFELNINLTDGEECNKLINGITALILNNDLDLRGIIFDKWGVLRELSYNSDDELFVDFAFNEKSDIRQRLTEEYEYSSHICEAFDFPLLTEDNIGNIYLFNFLRGGKIKVSLFEIKVKK